MIRRVVMMRRIRCAVLIALSAFLLASCSSNTAPHSNVGKGVGRDPELVESNHIVEPQDSDSGDTQDTRDSQDTRDTEDTQDTRDTEDTGNTGKAGAGEISWSIVDGKYVYDIGPRDESGLATLDEMYSVSTANYDDQPEDWYFGKTTYDETTGTVTYVWERSAAALESMQKYGGIYRGDETRKVIYLTFDCGYEYGSTTKILDVLKEKNVPSIFFVTGHYVKTEDELIRRMLDEGHLVGNHTVNHYKMSKLTLEQFMDELNGLEALFKEKFPDAPPMRYFRPPSGNCNEWTFRLADKMGYKTVMWSFAYYDYDTENQPPVDEALAKLKTALHPGAVYLLHAESETNVAILRDFIDWARQQGYEFLPICDIK